MKRLCLIPARSGSKGLKDKNIIPLRGKPLMAYTIEAAIESKLFDRVIVSTDSDEYGKIAMQYGAEYLPRSKEASSDTASSFMVVEDLFSKVSTDYDYFASLQVTSPFRNARHLIEAAELFDSKFDQFDFCVSMQMASYPSILSHKLEEDLSLKNFTYDYRYYRRQDHIEYIPNGAINYAKIEPYFKQGNFYGPKTIAYIMSKEDSIDIDDRIDLCLAEILMEERNR